MVTAPLSKKAISLAGYRIPGHTEYIAEKTGASAVIMMLVSDALRIVPATIHIPVSQVAVSLKKHRLVRTLTMLNHSLTHRSEERRVGKDIAYRSARESSHVI